MCTGPLFAQNKEGEIVWGQALTWADFKGKPDQKSPYSAGTHSGFTYSYSYTFKDGKSILKSATITAYFVSDRSWVKPGKQTPTLLSHEQVHFDISELYARKLRAAIDQVEMSTEDSQSIVQGLFREYTGKREQEQRRYDLETDHGKNRAEQLKWEKQIKQRLLHYSDYGD